MTINNQVQMLGSFPAFLLQSCNVFVRLYQTGLDSMMYKQIDAFSRGSQGVYIVSKSPSSSGTFKTSFLTDVEQHCLRMLGFQQKQSGPVAESPMAEHGEHHSGDT